MEDGMGNGHARGSMTRRSTVAIAAQQNGDASESHAKRRKLDVSGGDTDATSVGGQLERTFVALKHVLLRNDLDPSIMQYNPSKSSKKHRRPRRGRGGGGTESQVSTLSIVERLDQHLYFTLSELELDLEKTVAAVKSEIFDPFPYDTFLSSAKSLIRLEIGRISPTVFDEADAVIRLQKPSTGPDPLTATSNRQALYTIGPHGPLFTSLSFLPLPTPDQANIYNFTSDQGQILHAGKLDIMPLSGGLTQPVPPIGTSAGLPSKVTLGRRMPFRPVEDAAREYMQQRLKPKTTLAHHVEYLDYGAFASFAPEYDEGEALIDRETFAKLESSAAEQVLAQQVTEKLAAAGKKDIKKEEVAVQQLQEPEIDVSLLEEWQPEAEAAAERFKSEGVIANGDREDLPTKSLEERVEDLSLKIQTLEGLQFFRQSFDTAAVPSSYENKLAEFIESELKLLIEEYNIAPQSLLPASAIDFSRIIHRFAPSYRGSLPFVSEEPARVLASDRRSSTARTPRAREHSTLSTKKYSYTPKRDRLSAQ